MQFKKLLKIGLLSLLAIVIIGVVYRVFFYSGTNGQEVFYNDERLGVAANSVSAPAIEAPVVTQTFSEKAKATATKIAQNLSKPQVLLNVPFTSQAPLGDWNPPYNEACEEASMIMTYAWKNEQTLDADKVAKMINESYNWQSANGYDIDLNATQTAEVLKKYYKIESELIKNPSIAQIVGELEKGNVVLIPAAGRELGNPYFRQPGPLYHMLPLIGYDSQRSEFITNDPGTRRGQGYRYSYDVILNAIHDWNDGDVANGQKIISSVKK